MSTDIADVVESLVATSYALPGDYSVDPPRNICTEAADLISSLRQEVRGLEDQQWEFTSLLSDGANREKALCQEVETLREALKPFADAVYNDNGDVTVSYNGIDIGHWLRAYRLQRARPKDKP